MLASGGGGALYVDTLKNHRARTVPLVLELVPIVESLGGREATGCVAVRRTGRRFAAGIELEALGGLERGHDSCRRARLPGS